MNEQDYAMLLQRKEELTQEIAALDKQYREVAGEMEKAREALAPFKAELPNAKASLAALAQQVDDLKKVLDSLNKIKARLAVFDSLESQYSSFVKSFLNIIKVNKQYQAESRFDDSFELLKQISEMVEQYDFGTEAKVLLIAKEIIAHQRADAFAGKGFQRIDSGESPLSENEQNEYMSLADSLPCDFIDPADKAKHLCLSKRFELAALSLRQQVSLECLDEDILAYEGYINVPDLHHEEADLYAESIRSYASCAYGELFAKALADGDDEAAVALYQRRRPFLEPLPELVANAESEEELKKLLVIERSKEMDSAEFQATIIQLSSSNDEESLESLACIMSIEDLEATKKNILVKALEGWSFDQKVKLYALTIKKGLPIEQSESLYADLLATKPRRSQIESTYADLAFLRSSCPDKLKSKFAGLIKGLIRSPKAKRAKTKSKDEEFHKFFGESKYNEPIGKPLKTQKAYSYWSGGKSFLYLLAVLVLPLAVAGAGVYFMFFMFKMPEPVSYFEYGLPLIPILIGLCVHLIQRFGNDERIPTNISKIATILSIPLFGVALAYHFLPDALSVLEPYIGSMIVAGLSLMLLLVVPFKDKSKIWRFLIPSISAAIGIAAAVFFVLDKFF